MHPSTRSLPSRALRALLCASLTSLLVIACGDDGGAATGDAGPVGVDSGGMTALDGGPGLTCTEIFDCVVACPDGDDACSDACLALGSEEGLARANDLAVCADENGCTAAGATEECLTDSCAAEVLACANLEVPDGGVPDGGMIEPDAGGPTCSSGEGVPELTGALTGLSASYAAGETITVQLPVDADTRRATVTIYSTTSSLQLGSTATEVGSSTATLSLGAGTSTAPPGTYYLQVDLCSTSLCTTPLTRNLYDRIDGGTVYTERRVRPSTAPELCTTGIPIQTFTIN